MSNGLTHIGKYEITRILGEGAMGVVYEAFDPDIERQVAIKTLKKDLLTQSNQAEEFLARFKREAQAAAKCTHPNIVSVMDFGEDNNTPYMVMEYIDGQSLSQLLKKSNVLSLKQALTIISKLLSALNLAHSRGIIHRDIKPANIMLLESGKVKLADFGVARAENSSELTQVGMLIGTPKYMAPEQLVGEVADQRADLFALAVVFFDCLKVVKKIPQLQYTTLPPIPSLPTNNKLDYQQPIPEALISTLHTALAPDKSQRFQNAKEFFAAIKKDSIRLNEEVNNASASIDETVISSLSELSTKQVSSNSLNTSFSSFASGTISNQLADQTLIRSAIQTESTSSKVENLNSTNFLSGTDNSNDDSQLNTSTSLSKKTSPYNENDLDSFGLNLDHNTLIQLKQNLSEYIGPSAGQQVEKQIAFSMTSSELINGLASHIPNKKQRNKFIQRWSEV